MCVVVVVVVVVLFLPDAFRDALECALLLLLFCFVVILFLLFVCFFVFCFVLCFCVFFFRDAFRALKADSQPERQLGTVHAEKKGCLCWGSRAISVSVFILVYQNIALDASAAVRDFAFLVPTYHWRKLPQVSFLSRQSCD